MNPFRPGQLWRQVQCTTAEALGSGHLLPIRTTNRIVPDAGLDFLIRVVDALARKPAPAPGGAPSNPFLPYDPHLFVADVSATHVALLNKFMVVDHHLLLITRDFQHQETPLQPADFHALARCLAEYDSVGFYNAGKTSGASQPHRHLQLIPLPLDERLPGLAIERPLQPAAARAECVLRSGALPFAHRWWKFSPRATSSIETYAAACQQAYQSLVAAIGWTEVSPGTPYNLLVTRQWMMLVPRREECFAGISLNSLAFLGAMLVRDETQLEQLVAAGPMHALIATAGEPM
jgi:ATP adenylyltransferase